MGHTLSFYDLGQPSLHGARTTSRPCSFTLFSRGISCPSTVCIVFNKYNVHLLPCLSLFLNDGFQTPAELLRTGCHGYRQPVWAAGRAHLSHLLILYVRHRSEGSHFILKISVLCPWFVSMTLVGVSQGKLKKGTK